MTTPLHQSISPKGVMDVNDEDIILLQHRQEGYPTSSVIYVFSINTFDYFLLLFSNAHSLIIL